MSKVVVRNADSSNLGQTIARIFTEFAVELANRSVLLKPNFGAAVGPEKSALTDPRVVKAVLDGCLKQTRDVAIGDNPGNLDTGAMHTIRMSGILDLAADHYLNISKECEFMDIGSQIIPRVLVSKKIATVDYLINIPKWKTHVLCGLSCCIKNLYGHIVGDSQSHLPGTGAARNADDHDLQRLRLQHAPAQDQGRGRDRQTGVAGKLPRMSGCGNPVGSLPPRGVAEAELRLPAFESSPLAAGIGGRGGHSRPAGRGGDGTPG